MNLKLKLLIKLMVATILKLHTKILVDQMPLLLKQNLERIKVQLLSQSNKLLMAEQAGQL